MAGDPHILLVDDERDIRDPLASYLSRNGLRVTKAENAAAARQLLTAYAIDLVLLDIMMPGEDGLSLAGYIRATTSVPVILLTAKAEEMDRVVGLEIGADDYIPKPFSTRELIARIRAVLRRRPVESGASAKSGEQVRFAGWSVDIRRRAVFSPSGASIELTGAEFDLLSSFINSPQRVLGRERLIELSRVRLGDSSDRSIDVLVSRLRRKLSSAGQSPPIVTVRGVGYMLTADVTHG
jgi:two-component system, OmpR family, response regulator